MDQVKERKPKLAFILFVSLVPAIFCALPLVLYLIFLGYFKIPQEGMYPTLPAGSTFFVLKHPYNDPSDVRRGDIIVYKKLIDGKKYNLIWRVIGLPGETIDVKEDQVIINTVQVQRSLLRNEGSIKIYKETLGERTYTVAYDTNAPQAHRLRASLQVPSNHFFVLGDNRFNALDSRHYGTVPFETIFGRKLFQ